MAFESAAFVQGFIGICQDGWEMGWHERNGGNLTYRLSREEVQEVRADLAFDRPWSPMGVQADNLAGQYFLTTGTGKFFRNVARAPQQNIGLVEINEAGDAWRIVWGLQGDANPTSEFPAHYMNHSVRCEVTGGKCRVIYHAHTPALIAMSHVLPPDPKVFTQALWRMMSECPVIFPGGVGVLEWMVPGSVEIAQRTGVLMREYDAVVWVHHGLFASGPDFDTTFGLMHAIEKAADIYVRARGCGEGIPFAITDDELRAIARDFGLTLNEAMLDSPKEGRIGF